MTASSPTLAQAAILVGSMLFAGCYLSHERPDDSVPPSECVDDEATVALTPANWTPGGCQEIEVLVVPDAICHVPPETSRDGEMTYPEEWRRVRFVNTTDRAAFASIFPFVESCPTPGVACWAYFQTPPEVPCGCGAGGGAGAIPVMGTPSIHFEVAAHGETQFTVTGPTARYVLRLCDGVTG